MSRKLAFLASSLSLLVGGLLYLCFRPESLVMFGWVKMLGLYPAVLELRMQSTTLASSLPEWLIFSAPNGLWVFSFGTLMVSLWAPTGFSVAVNWAIALWAVGIVSEVMQVFSLVPGFFDVADIVAYTVGLLGFFGFIVGQQKHGL